MEELFLTFNPHLAVEGPLLAVEPIVLLEIVVVQQSTGDAVEILVVELGDRLPNCSR
jgi:hypothetical protein